MSTSEESLSSILSNAEPVEAKVEAPAEPVVETKVEPVRDDAGKFKAPDKAPEPAKEPEKPRVSRETAGIIDERRKRQEAEARLAAYEAKQPTTDIWDDPQRAITEQVYAGVAPLKEALFEMTFEAMRDRHADFDEVAEAFAKASETDPKLIEGMRAAKNPAKYVYNIGVQLKELSDVGGDFTKYREKVQGELKTQLDSTAKERDALKAELEALKANQAELAAVPRSLNSVSSGPAPKAGEEDPEDIKSIARFGNKRH